MSLQVSSLERGSQRTLRGFFAPTLNDALWMFSNGYGKAPPKITRRRGKLRLEIKPSHETTVSCSTWNPLVFETTAQMFLINCPALGESLKEEFPFQTSIALNEIEIESARRRHAAPVAVFLLHGSLASELVRSLLSDFLIDRGDRISPKRLICIQEVHGSDIDSVMEKISRSMQFSWSIPESYEF